MLSPWLSRYLVQKSINRSAWKPCVEVPLQLKSLKPPQIYTPRIRAIKFMRRTRLKLFLFIHQIKSVDSHELENIRSSK